MSHTSHKLKFQVESVIQKLHAVQTKKVQAKGQFLRRQIDASIAPLVDTCSLYFLSFSSNARAHSPPTPGKLEPNSQRVSEVLTRFVMKSVVTNPLGMP